MQLLYLDPAQIERDGGGIREEEGDLAGLAETIRDQGLLQPLGVVPLGRERYRVVYGGRRLGAAIQLGLERVPCVILDQEDPDLLLQQLIENVQRRDLNDLEKARAFRRLREQIVEQHGPLPEGELDERIGKAVGIAPRTVRRYLGLLDLPEEIQELIRNEELSVTQAQHLRRIPRARTQIELAHLIADEGLADAEAFAPAEAGVPSSRNKARVFRVKSLDQMVDETDRMARAYYDGDLRTWVQSDETAPFKVRLLLKQLRNLTRALEELAGEHGWTLGEE